METCQHHLKDLFQQLGLALELHEIDKFVHTHPLSSETKLKDAPFWNSSQKQFLSEAFELDSAWSHAADHLATLLVQTTNSKKVVNDS